MNYLNRTRVLCLLFFLFNGSYLYMVSILHSAVSQSIFKVYIYLFYYDP